MTWKKLKKRERESKGFEYVFYQRRYIDDK